MKTICIIPSKAEELKKAFRSGEISISKLFLMNPQARLDLFSKYLGEEIAKEFLAKLEKNYMSPIQAQAIKRTIAKDILQVKPLYKNVTTKTSSALRDKYSMKDLRNMSNEKRINKLSNIFGEKLGSKLNTRFKNLMKTGNLQLWEDRVLGTNQLRESKNLKGEIAKLEEMQDLGVLNPSSLKDFMKSYVEIKVGASLNVDESIKLSKLIDVQRASFDKFMEKGGQVILENKQEFIDYLNSVKDIKEFQSKFVTYDSEAIGNILTDVARSNILFAAGTLRNSFLYQLFPTIERTIAKNIIPSTVEKELNTNIVERLVAKLSGTLPSVDATKFIKGQIKMGAEIYHKTGFDIARMESLNDSYNFFGGEKFQQYYGKKSVKEAEGFKNKLGTFLNNYARFTNLGPKWGAGGTDMIGANLLRANNSVVMAKERSFLESKKGKLPNGMTQKERELELIKESYSFNPKDKQAEKIRQLGIYDAQVGNNTQPDGLADMTINLRNALKLGNINFGKVLVPFAKIATASISQGLQSAIPIGVFKSIHKINQASKLEGIDRQIEIQKRTSDLIRFLGITGTAVLIALFLDDDDYVGPYTSLSVKEYKMARARGASPSQIRIGGRWIPTRYLPIINITLSAIMTARQHKTKGDYRQMLLGYVKGATGAILGTPVLKEISESIIKKAEKLQKSKDIEDALNDLGLDGKSIVDWAKVRVIPRTITKEIAENIFKKDSKYDFLGQEIKKGVFKKDKTNQIMIEFSNLDKDGFMPAISDPTGEDPLKKKKELGDYHYEKLLAEYKREYANKVSDLINTDRYKRRTSKSKKDKIDNLRKKYIINKF